MTDQDPPDYIIKAFAFAAERRVEIADRQRELNARRVEIADRQRELNANRRVLERNRAALDDLTPLVVGFVLIVALIAMVLVPLVIGVPQ